MFKIFIFYFIHSFFFFIFYFFIFLFLHFMYEKEVTSAWNPSNRKFLREKRKSSLKFKAKNWDFGREEWNNYHCKFVLLCKSKLLTDQWRKKKKSNQRIVLQRGREIWRKERRETIIERERSMGREDTRVSDSEDVRREKVNGREKKRESLPWERD